MHVTYMTRLEEICCPKHLVPISLSRTSQAAMVYSDIIDLRTYFRNIFRIGATFQAPNYWANLFIRKQPFGKLKEKTSVQWPIYLINCIHCDIWYHCIVCWWILHCNCGLTDRVQFVPQSWGLTDKECQSVTMCTSTTELVLTISAGYISFYSELTMVQSSI